MLHFFTVLKPQSLRKLPKSLKRPKRPKKKPTESTKKTAKTEIPKTDTKPKKMARPRPRTATPTRRPPNVKPKKTNSVHPNGYLEGLGKPKHPLYLKHTKESPMKLSLNMKPEGKKRWKRKRTEWTNIRKNLQTCTMVTR